MDASGPEPFTVTRGEALLVGDRRAGPGPTMILLHSGVTDRRGWAGVAERLAGRVPLVAYDRRGHGDSPPPTGEFRHVDDLAAVVDATSDGPVWLAGCSAGGGLALDAALEIPDRIAGLVLISPAVSGAPEPASYDPDFERIGAAWDVASEAGDAAELNRLETWVWLDGPGQPEGRVGDPPRSLVLAMNRRILASGVAEDAGSSGIDAWGRLGEITVPVTVACGELDVPFLVERSADLAGRLPRGRHVALPGVAHLPHVERPASIAALLTETLGLGPD